MDILTALDWYEIFTAGWNAIPGKSEPAANALALALRAMANKAREIADRQRLGGVQQS